MAMAMAMVIVQKRQLIVVVIDLLTPTYVLSKEQGKV